LRGKSSKLFFTERRETSVEMKRRVPWALSRTMHRMRANNEGTWWRTGPLQNQAEEKLPESRRKKGGKGHWWRREEEDVFPGRNIIRGTERCVHSPKALQVP